MSTVRNGTTEASGTGPAFGYNVVLYHLFIMFFLFLYRLNVNTSNPYTVIILLIFTHSMICFMFFEIKIYRKMPKNLTAVTRLGVGKRKRRRKKDKERERKKEKKRRKENRKNELSIFRNYNLHFILTVLLLNNKNEM
jgi:Na+/melibiose symporter-like transporter